MSASASVQQILGWILTVSFGAIALLILGINVAQGISNNWGMIAGWIGLAVAVCPYNVFLLPVWGRVGLGWLCLYLV